MSYTIVVVSKRAFLSSKKNEHKVVVLFAATNKNIIKAEQECERFRGHQRDGEKWDFVIATYPGETYQGSIVQGWRLKETAYNNDLAYMEYNDLEKFRGELELTQAQMARLLGYSDAAYRRWKTAQNGVPENIAKCVELLGLLSKQYLTKLTARYKFSK